MTLANELNMNEAGEIELARIWTKVEKIREKQANKPKHSPLPQASVKPSLPSGKLYLEVDASKEFPSGIQNVKCVSKLSGTEMKGVGLFNSTTNFVITYLNGSRHTHDDIELSEIFWLKPLSREVKEGENNNQKI